MNDPTIKNVHVVVKQVNKFDGKGAGYVLEWQTKLHTALILYSRPFFNALEHLPSENTDDTTDRVTWNNANRNLFCVLFFTTSGSAFSVIRRIKGNRS